MATEQKLCVNCKHLKDEVFSTKYCCRSVKYTKSKPDPVDGSTRIYKSGLLDARDERAYSSVNRCSAEGRFYEEKRWRQRLILWAGI